MTDKKLFVKLKYLYINQTTFKFGQDQYYIKK